MLEDQLNGEADGDSKRQSKNNMLKMYYGIDQSNDQENSNDPLDIDSPSFNSEFFLRKLKQVSKD